MKRKASRSDSSVRPRKRLRLSATATAATSLSVAGVAAEVSEEAADMAVPGLRRMTTLPVADDGSSVAAAAGSSSGSAEGVRLAKKDSVVSLDASGAVTTLTRLASGSSVGVTAALSTLPAAVRKELSKAASSASASKLPSVRVPTEAVAASEVATTSGAEAEKISAGPSTVPLPPGGLIEIVFSFDTTGSMNSVLNEVRGRVGDMIQRLQADIAGIRIAVIAHGDYCDESNYVIKWIDFGASVAELCTFVQTISGTGGGDFDECYELVMARAQTVLSWTPGSQRSLVMIGDATPHPPSYYNGKDEKLDWKDEAQKLASMGVKIYAVQAKNERKSEKFYKTIADITKGRHLKLDQFNNIFHIIMAVCYHEKGVEFVRAYEDEVRETEGDAPLHKDLEGLFSAFRGGKASAAPKASLKGAASKVKGAAKAKGAPSSKGAATKRKPAAAKRLPRGTAKTKAVLKAKPGSRTVAGAGKTPKKKSDKVKAKTSKASKTSKVKSKAGAKAAARAARGKGKGVKSVKGRKSVKRTPKKTTSTRRTAKKLSPGVKRKHREAVKDEDLDASSVVKKKVVWSPWTKAIIPPSLRPRGKLASLYKPRTTETTRRPRAGLRHVGLLRNLPLNLPALYEFAVQPAGSRRRYVVYLRPRGGWRKRAAWDSLLLAAQDVHREVEAVVQGGGSVWLRRGAVNSQQDLKEVVRHLHDNYDYAWRKKGQRSSTASSSSSSSCSSHRRLKRGNVLISGN